MGHLGQRKDCEENRRYDSVIEFPSLDNLSDSDRADAEIDRIIAETNMMELTKTNCASSTFQENHGIEENGKRLDLDDSDPETLIMRMNLLESLQNKLGVNDEREDGEVSDEEACSGQDPFIKVTPDCSSTSRKNKYRTRKLERSGRRDEVKREKKRLTKSRSTSATESSRRYSSRHKYLYEENSERSIRTRGSASQLKTHDRRSRISSPSTYSSSHRLGSSRRDVTKGKGETSQKHAVPELSITLPVSPNGPNNSEVLITSQSQNGRSSPLLRVVEASTSIGTLESRSIKRVIDSGSHISVTVNTISEEHESLFSTSKTCEGSHASESVVSTRDLTSYSGCRSGLSRINRRNLTTDSTKSDAYTPLPQPQVPCHASTPHCSEDLLVLPPPPAPPVLSKSPDTMENCHPSSIRVQVREGGGRVAQLSTNTKAKDISTEQKRNELKISQHLTAHPPPSLPLPAENPDNYDNVGMDVESSHSSGSSIVGNEESEALTRHRVLSEADETQLREMLLNQVILNRMRKAESDKQSSDASLCGTSTNRATLVANNAASRNESGNIELRSVFTQTDNLNDNQQCREVQRMCESTPVTVKRCSLDWCDSSEPLRKMKKVGVSLEADEVSSSNSPQQYSFSELELLFSEKQSQLSELDKEISELMAYLSSSLHRRTELKNTLAELEADIDTGRAQCRILMKRRNVVRRAVERYEERRLDRLLSNEWDFDGDATKSQPNGEQTEAQSAGSVSRSSSIERLLGTEYSIDGSETWNEEHAMRLKLLAKMKTTDPTTSSSSRDMVNRETLCNDEDFCNRSTQTATVDEVDIDAELKPLYRSDSFPQRLRRFFGLPSDMSAFTATCPNEMSGKKCADVYCESKHTKDEELTTVDVLSMLITHVPGLVFSEESKDITRQAVELKARRLPNERFGVFARRLLDELPPSRRSTGSERSHQEKMGVRIQVNSIDCRVKEKVKFTVCERDTREREREREARGKGVSSGNIQRTLCLDIFGVYPVLHSTNYM